MCLNRLPHIVRLLLLTLIVGSIWAAVALTSRVPVHAAGTQPTWALPFPTGTSVDIGPLGLHDHNFGSMKDDRTGKVFTFSQKLAPDSLDIVLQPPQTGTSSIPTISVASGTILAVWAACQLVLADYGSGWWGMYLHMANIKVVSGDSVQTGSIIGYPTTKKPTLTACGSVESTAEHVHFVLLNGSGTTGGYVSLLGKVLCGHKVVELNNDLTDIILQGLTQTKDQVFNVPTCQSGSSITEFPIPTSNSNPQGITAGPDGNLWFVEGNADKIGRMTPSGSFTEYNVPTSNSNNLQDITAGPDGNLWFTEQSGNKIGKITTNGTITEYPLPSSTSDPTGITAGPDGNLWFTEFTLYHQDQIGKITTNGTITEYPTPTSNSLPLGITKGPDGNLWFTESSGNNIGRLIP